MKIHIRILAAVVAVVITLLDINLVECYFKWWQVLLFDITVLLMLAVIYGQLSWKSMQKEIDKIEEEYYKDRF